MSDPVKVIPSKGTRLKGALYLAVFSIAAWVLSIIFLKMAWLSGENAELMLWTPEHVKWGLMSAFGFYATSETIVKGVEGRMNRP